MKDRILYLVIPVLSMLVWACQEDEEFFEYDPSFTMVFINKDSIDVIQEDTLTVLSDSLAVLSSELAKFEGHAEDTLANIENLQDRIDDSQDTQEIEELEKERDENLSALMDLQEITGQLETDKDSILNKTTFWNGIVSMMESGLVLLSRLENKENGEDKTYIDSLTSWRIPLSLNANSVSLGITIDDNEYSIDVNYDLITTVNEEDFVVREPFDINIESHGFDSLVKKCQTSECFGSETTVTVFF